MPKRSVRWPFRIVGGKVPWTADPMLPGADRAESLRQIIRARFLDVSTRHPWRAPDGLPDLAFTIADARRCSAIRERVVAFFRGLEGRRRAKLISVEVSPRDGRIVGRCSYLDLEEGRREELEVA